MESRSDAKELEKRTHGTNEYVKSERSPFPRKQGECWQEEVKGVISLCEIKRRHRKSAKNGESVPLDLRKRETDRQTDRQTDKDRDRAREQDREAEIQTRQKDKQTDLDRQTETRNEEFGIKPNCRTNKWNPKEQNGEKERQSK